jgi:hypothetical protein
LTSTRPCVPGAKDAWSQPITIITRDDVVERILSHLNSVAGQYYPTILSSESKSVNFHRAVDRSAFADNLDRALNVTGQPQRTKKGESMPEHYGEAIDVLLTTTPNPMTLASWIEARKQGSADHSTP